MKAMRFAIKHAVATCVVVGGIGVLAATAYSALLVWAVFAGQPLGGPLALPFIVLGALAGGLASVGLVLLPVTAVTEWIAARSRLRVALQIPIATALSAAFFLLAAIVASSLGEVPWNRAAMTAAAGFALGLLPLGAYWWSTQTADCFLRVAQGWWRLFRRP